MSTSLPGLIEYQLALQHPATAFADAELQSGTVRSDPLGMPRVVSGGFALTYDVKTAQGRSAVRCFHRASNNLEGRYRAIAPLVRQMPDVFVPVEFQPEGVLVQGRGYPIIRMPWVVGTQLGAYLAKNHQPADLDRLEAGLAAIVAKLELAGAAHGDLQHGNIIVDQSGQVRLIDYDGVFVPALAGQPASEAGHVNYQHPMRSRQFDGTIDRFSAIALTVALRSLKAKPDLWDRYWDGQNVLFRRPDYVDPASSALFAELKRLPQVEPLATSLEQIAGAPFESVPRLEDFLSGQFQVVARPAEATRPALTVQYRVVDASRREEIMDLEGEVITVVGQVVGWKLGETYRGDPYMFVNFGDWRDGTFTLVLWAEALAGVEDQIRSLKGNWVSYTGLAAVYAGRTPSRPQVIVDNPAGIQAISRQDAMALLRATWREEPADGVPSTDVHVPRAGASNGSPHRDRPERAAGSVSGINTPRAKRVAAPSQAPTPQKTSSTSTPHLAQQPGPYAIPTKGAGPQKQAPVQPAGPSMKMIWLIAGIAAVGSVIVIALMLVN